MHIANGDESHPHMSCALDWKRFRAESIRHTGHFGGQDRQTARAARFPHAMTRQHMGWCGSAMLKEHGLGMHCGPDPPFALPRETETTTKQRACARVVHMPVRTRASDNGLITMTRQHMGWCGSAMLKEHGLGMHCGPDPRFALPRETETTTKQRACARVVHIPVRTRASAAADGLVWQYNATVGK
ncbi:hypothetical protein BCR44DRAFT_1445444 [Catenaria anguillulae PL171]|uniref:Uncharacterized protein n=1 Tax=Catenaria anguillulae PL171 TaxID=765915 RepID=A0A1Y2H6S9_9FUNG|nr:hypothetical protein BCR44DRAFT_1445444 [Catenaria anguillulae PL171]